MKIHEYQAKAILARHGVPVPRGEVAFNAAEVGEIARRLGGSVVVVKAQIHAGGRGKGGGVKLARSAEEAADIAGHILDRKSTRLNSSHTVISYAVFCLKKKRRPRRMCDSGQGGRRHGVFRG